MPMYPLSPASRTSSLTREREVHLVSAWQRYRSEAAARELVSAQQRNVVALARKYTRYGPSVDELVSEGNAGLARALERFDLRREVRFVTYAAYWMRAYMLDYALRTWSVVRDRSGALNSRYFFRLRRERARLQARGVEDIDGALAERLGLSRRQIGAMLRGVDRRDVSLDHRVDGASPIQERLPTVETDQEAQAAASERRELAARVVREALTWLNARERRVVDARLMRSPEERPSLATLGAELGVTRERVRQIENRAKQKIRDGICRLPDLDPLDLFVFD